MCFPKRLDSYRDIAGKKEHQLRETLQNCAAVPEDYRVSAPRMALYDCHAVLLTFALLSNAYLFYIENSIVRWKPRVVVTHVCDVYDLYPCLVVVCIAPSPASCHRHPGDDSADRHAYKLITDYFSVRLILFFCYQCGSASAVDTCKAHRGEHTAHALSSSVLCGCPSHPPLQPHFQARCYPSQSKLSHTPHITVTYSTSIPSVFHAQSVHFLYVSPPSLFPFLCYPPCLRGSELRRIAL